MKLKVCGLQQRNTDQCINYLGSTSYLGVVKSETRRDAETLVWKSETETWKL